MACSHGAYTEGQESILKLPIILTIGNPTPTFASFSPKREETHRPLANSRGRGRRKTPYKVNRGACCGDRVSGTDGHTHTYNPHKTHHKQTPPQFTFSPHSTAEPGGPSEKPLLRGGRVSCSRRAREGPGPHARGFPARPSPAPRGEEWGNEPLSSRALPRS